MMKLVNYIYAAMLCLCLAPMPYGYYSIIRLLGLILFAVLAYKYYQQKREGLAITCGALAVLFQPFIKIALGKGLWNIVDIIVAIFLVIITIKDKATFNQ